MYHSINNGFSMRSFFAALLDVVFPSSARARIVRDTSFAALKVAYAPRAVGDSTALARYREPLVRALIHEAKFRRNERAIALLGQLLAEHLERTDTSLHLVLVPLSSERLRERGYNQVNEIARAAHAHIPRLHIHDELLKKVRHTPPQMSLARSERLHNLAGAFAIGEHALPYDTPLILFDDIVTTGSTLAEAARTLEAAGFTRITLLALAH